MSAPAKPNKTRWLKKTVTGPKVTQARRRTQTEGTTNEEGIGPPPQNDTNPPQLDANVATPYTRARKRTISTTSETTESPKVDGDDNKPFYDAPDPTTMTMQELIYYNPSANPMSSISKKKRKKIKNKDDSTEQSNIDNDDNGEDIGDSEFNSGDSGNEVESEDDVRMVPQLKIGPDGKIQVDEASIVVQTTQKRSPKLSETVTEIFDEHTICSSFRHLYRIRKWTTDETNQFYKALSQVGTDFTMMALVMPMRSRKELKNKFKKEEKCNPHRVAAAFKKQSGQISKT